MEVNKRKSKKIPASLVIGERFLKNIFQRHFGDIVVKMTKIENLKTVSKILILLQYSLSWQRLTLDLTQPLPFVIKKYSD